MMEESTKSLFAKLNAAYLNAAPMEESPRGNKRLDERVVQKPLQFSNKPRVAIVDSLTTLNKVDQYKDLQEVELSQQDQQLVSSVASNLRQNDPQILITDFTYDSQTNTIYLVTCRVDYAFIVCLSSGMINVAQPLAKTGVLAPIVTADGYTVLFERANEKNNYLQLNPGLLSVPGGFLDFADKAGASGHNQNIDIVILNALKEVGEECLWDENNKFRVTIKSAQTVAASYRYFRNLKPHYSTDLQNSPRKSPMVTLEFITALYLDCALSDLRTVLDSNVAKDRQEHCGEMNKDGTYRLKYEVIDLKEKSALPAVREELSDYYPGSFLFDPVLLGMESS